MKWPITYDDVVSAAERISPFLQETPLRTYPALNRAVGCCVLVKHESFQPTGAFKVRNALAALTLLSRDERLRGVVAATCGNHGIGLAFAGRQLGVPVTVCVPKGNSRMKNEVIDAFGARLVEVGEDYDEAVEFVADLADRERMRSVHATNDAGVLAGAATITLEALNQAKSIGRNIHGMFFAVGGGSQAVGALTVLSAENLSIPVIGVQAANAPAIHDLFHSIEPTATTASETIADGIATRNTYEMTFDALKHRLDDMLEVSEAQIAEAVRLVLSTTHSLVEGAGAVGLAGLRQAAKQFRDKTVLIVLTGANIDSCTLRRFLSGASDDALHTDLLAPNSRKSQRM